MGEMGFGEISWRFHGDSQGLFRKMSFYGNSRRIWLKTLKTSDLHPLHTLGGYLLRLVVSNTVCLMYIQSSLLRTFRAWLRGLRRVTFSGSLSIQYSMCSHILIPLKAQASSNTLFSLYIPRRHYEPFLCFWEQIPSMAQHQQRQGTTPRNCLPKSRQWRNRDTRDVWDVQILKIRSSAGMTERNLHCKYIIVVT